MLNRFELKRRNNTVSKRTIIITIIIALITSFGVGFASLQSKIKMTGAVSLEKTKIEVYFANLSIGSELTNITGNSATISSDLRLVNFTTNLNNGKDYFEFEVDIVNSGKIDVMFGSDFQIKGIPENLKPYINTIITYSDGIEVEPNYILKSNSTEKIKVRVETTNKSITSSTGVLTLNLEIPNTVASFDSSNRPYYLSSFMTRNASNDSSLVFSEMPSDTNGNGLNYRDTNGIRIYYFRGNVTNNNLIYANHCWKIVRTTETGGTKIIYNGIATDDNICSNAYGTATELQKSVYNENSDDPKYVGYTYEENGIQVNSTIKNVIDSWYEANILNKYDNYLEDTVWCNDRSKTYISSSGSYIQFGTYQRIHNDNSPSLTCEKEYSYTLKNTAKGYNHNLNGNELLNYPVALLTADEMILGGGVKYLTDESEEIDDYYLRTNINTWTLSPYMYDLAARMYDNNYMGYLSNFYVYTQTLSVRPAVSLAPNTLVSFRNDSEPGTAKNPYIVK